MLTLYCNILRMLNTYLVIASALVAAQVTAFPNGAPRSACASMAPIHMLFGAQSGDVPFTLSVSSGESNSASPVTGNYNKNWPNY